jgi:cation:H+ antiporter
MVHGAVDLARQLGVSELLIALTVVAAGTSLPEVATSVMASIRGQRDIAIGNVVGSNIFNILAVLGLTAIVAPGGVGVAPAALRFDIPVMTAVAVVCLPIFFTGSRISRWEGALLLGYYIAYVTFLALSGTGHASMNTFSHAMLWIVIPLSLIGILLSVAYGVTGERAPGS